MLQTQLWCNSKFSKFTTHPAQGLTSHHSSRINIYTSELDQAGISCTPLNSCYSDQRLNLQIISHLIGLQTVYTKSAVSRVNIKHHGWLLANCSKDSLTTHRHLILNARRQTVKLTLTSCLLPTKIKFSTTQPENQLSNAAFVVAP